MQRSFKLARRATSTISELHPTSPQRLNISICLNSLFIYVLSAANGPISSYPDIEGATQSLNDPNTPQWQSISQYNFLFKSDLESGTER